MYSIECSTGALPARSAKLEQQAIVEYMAADTKICMGNRKDDAEY